MRLTRNDGKMGVALGVLKHVKLKRDDVFVQAYSNCREQGLFLTNLFSQGSRGCSFAENRSSDDIIVQFGERDDFDDYGVLSEDKYGTNKKYFQCGEHEQAGAFVTTWLKGADTHA